MWECPSLGYVGLGGFVLYLFDYLRLFSIHPLLSSSSFWFTRGCFLHLDLLCCGLASVCMNSTSSREEQLDNDD